MRVVCCQLSPSVEPLQGAEPIALPTNWPYDDPSRGGRGAPEHATTRSPTAARFTIRPRYGTGDSMEAPSRVKLT